MSDEIANTVAKSDSVHGTAMEAVKVLMSDIGGGKTACIRLDAGSQQLVINVLGANGQQVAGEGSVSINLYNLVELAGLLNCDATFRVLQWKDANTCTLWKAAFLMTEPESVT